MRLVSTLLRPPLQEHRGTVSRCRYYPRDDTPFHLYLIFKMPEKDFLLFNLQMAGAIG